MAVKVLIKRRFKEGRSMEVFALLRKFRSEAIEQKGYLTGETLINYDDPQTLLVVSTWQSMENWLNWKNNPSRIANEARLQQYLEEPAEYESYVFGAYPAKKR